jgi:hemerythrin-like domain-containing protein
VNGGLETLDALEQEHRRADSLHAQVEILGKQRLAEGSLSPSPAGQFREAVADLASMYERHIQIEDEPVFPIAERVLSQADKVIIAPEASARRA